MTDERDDPLGGRDERRPDRDRNRNVNPSSREAPELWSVLLQLGVNIYDQDSIRQFSEAMEWAIEAKKREQKRYDLRRQIFAGGAIGAVVAGLSWLITWLSSHNIGGQH
jgi:hypothetical protein